MGQAPLLCPGPALFVFVLLLAWSGGWGLIPMHGLVAHEWEWVWERRKSHRLIQSILDCVELLRREVEEHREEVPAGIVRHGKLENALFLMDFSPP